MVSISLDQNINVIMHFITLVNYIDDIDEDKNQFQHYICALFVSFYKNEKKIMEKKTAITTTITFVMSI